MKNANEVTDDSATHESVAVPKGRDRKIRTAQISTIRLQISYCAL